MHDLWSALGALAAIVLPMALAGWLLGRTPKQPPPHTDRRGNMRGKEDR